MSARAALLLATLLAVPPILAQGPPDQAATIAAQRDALKVFAPLDGVWRGHIPYCAASHISAEATQDSFLPQEYGGQILLVVREITAKQHAFKRSQDMAAGLLTGKEQAID